MSKTIALNTAFVFLSLLVISCGTLVKHDTPSGRPEVTISGNVRSEASSQIINAMIDSGYSVMSSSDTLLVFERPVDNIMAAALLGSRYDSQPNFRVTYTIVETYNSTRIICSLASITNPGSAFERTLSMDNNPDSVHFQELLNQVKVTLERR